jgi:ribonuclease J
MVEAARKTGYLDPALSFLRDEEAARLPRRETLLICTGSQGEPRAALARIAAGEYSTIRLEEGDAVIFSARLIPGNERAIGRVINRFVRAGIEVVTEKSAFVHVSGHPARDELIRMYQLVRPRIAVPVHGEARHLMEQAALARACQVPEAVVADNGSVVRLAPGPAATVARVPSGRLGADGVRLVDLEAETLRERRRMAYNGSAVATLVVTSGGVLVGEPQVSILGLVEEEEAARLKAAVAERIRAAVAELPAAKRADDEAVRECARHAVRRSVFDALGRRPVTEIHLLRV